MESNEFCLGEIYRALEVIAKESERIQAQVYENSKALVERETSILYYDCTNYYFEIEREDGIRQYGVSKEHRPNPIVGMGLFMDGSGAPLAFSINPGAGNEQPTLIPLEKRIMNDFALSKFIVCTDAGLGSGANRLFNDAKERAYVVTQSLKKMESSLIEWALAPDGWRLAGSGALTSLTQIDDSSANQNIYYKEREIRSEVKDEQGQAQILQQKLIVSYSPKYKAYQRAIRAIQVERAQRIADNPARLNHKKANDPTRLLDQTHVTADGEVAKRKRVALSQKTIDEEAKFDGFYGVCSNLSEDIETILRINKGRWEIEESFRLLKSDFRTRPVYLSRESHIRAHFLTCFLALLVYRILEKLLNGAFTSGQILSTLTDMDFLDLGEKGYVPAYTRTPLTDALHDAFGFRTDYQIITKKKMKHIVDRSKNAQTLRKKLGA
jgi:transposase